MQNRTKLFFAFLLICSSASGQAFRQRFIASDIPLFWKAYTESRQLKDSASQRQRLQQYLDNGSAGLRSLVEMRNYSAGEYLSYIQDAPRFWTSINADLHSVPALYPAIQKDIAKLKKLYPALQPVPVYFTVGAFRSNGTAQRDKVIIGCELAVASDRIVTTELPEHLQTFYKVNHPRRNIALLCTHEYVHTQQKEMVHNLLSQCLYEGVAEFVSCTATGKASYVPAIAFGKANRQRVVDQFVNDLFTMSADFNWLWGQNTNELKERDLGYYIGYEIAERYYQAAKNKQAAVRELIELDYHNEDLVEKIVDDSKLLPQPLRVLYEEYEAQRPRVVSVSLSDDDRQEIKPGIRRITIHFSEPLNGYNTGLDYGPQGEAALPKINLHNRNWSPDKKSYSFEADLQPGKHYQLLITNAFRKENGIRLKPFLLEFKTAL